MRHYCNTRICLIPACCALCTFLVLFWSKRNSVLSSSYPDWASQSVPYTSLANVSTSTNNSTTPGRKGKNLIIPEDKAPRFTHVNAVPDVRVPQVNCAKLFRGDENEIKHGEQFHKLHPKRAFPDQEYLKMANNCESFRRDRHYLDLPVNKEESEFPIAFSILIFKDIEQFERLLRAIYRPQNVYCVHVDKKSPPTFWNATKAIVRCFDNVFLASKSSDVRWGTWSVLEPELTCMRDLLHYKSWRYFINLTGQEFPLKTNLDLVRILTIFNGANNMEGTVKRRNMGRFKNKSPLPANITITKGAVHITACRAFVHYIINNKTAKAFASWVKQTSVPDETFFSSLNYSPQLNIPGAFIGEPETNTDKNLFITRFKNWGSWPFEYPCYGNRVHGICIIGLRELSLLPSRPELFVNKFFLEREQLALDCMEELHYNRTRAQVECEDDHHLDLKFYKELDFVRHHISVDWKV